MPTMRVTLPLLLATAACALDIAPGDTAWLDQRQRPEWVQTTVQTVLDQIARTSGRSIIRSPGLAAIESEALVTVVAPERVPLRDILGWLEETNHLHFTAEPLVLRVETASDRRNARRRFVDLNLSAYGAGLTVQDHHLAPLGFPAFNPAGRGGGFFLAGVNGEAAPQTIDAAELLELMQEAFVDPTAQAQGYLGRSHVWVTSEEEAAMRSMLDEQFRLRTMQRSWRITFGTLTNGPIIPGLRPVAEIPPLIDRLTDRRTLSLSGLHGKQVIAGNLAEQVQLAAAEVVNHQLDPVVETLLTGVGATLRAYQGSGLIYLDYALAWVDPQATRQVTVRNPGRPAQRSVAVSALPRRDDQGVQVETELAEEPALGGERFDLDLSTLWSWMPRGTVLLGNEQALVLIAARQDSRAIIIVEPLP